MWYNLTQLYTNNYYLCLFYSLSNVEVYFNNYFNK